MKTILKETIKKINIEYLHRNERAFTYELYHQLRLMELPNKTEVTCETKKNQFHTTDVEKFNPIIKKYFYNNEEIINLKIYKYPDLLIHEYLTINNQLLAIEVKKRFNPNSFVKDLAKLAAYCTGRLKYKNGIMIILSPRRDSIVEIPEVPEILINFPMIEIWILNELNIEVINSLSLNQ